MTTVREHLSARVDDALALLDDELDHHDVRGLVYDYEVLAGVVTSLFEILDDAARFGRDPLETVVYANELARGELGCSGVPKKYEGSA